MCHDVLEFNIVIEGQGGPRPPECVKAMSFMRNVPVCQYFLQGISDVGIYDLGVWKVTIDKKRGDGWEVA